MRSILISRLILIFLLILKFKTISAYGRMYTSNMGNKYYIETDQKFTWTEGLIKCMELDMTLMSVDTEEKAKEIDQLFKREFGKTIYVWLGGLMSRYPKNYYVWLSTGMEFNYTHWEKNSPNFLDQQQFCVEIGYDNMEWNDYHCQKERGFICETKPQQKELQQEIEKQQKLQKEIENLKTKLKQQNANYEMELENYRKQLRNETEERQKMQKELQEKEKYENVLQEELKEKEDLEKVVREKLQEKEKLEKLLRDELNDLKVNLKQPEEKLFTDKDLYSQVEFVRQNQFLDKKYHNFILHLHQDRYTIN
ncbi:uncharacterized protein ACRADG_001565 [Cochliomyia hominivorax]